MASKKVYFNSCLYFFHPLLERVCKKYDNRTGKILTAFRLIYQALKEPALKFEKRPHDQNSNIQVEVLVPDRTTTDALVYQRNELGERLLIKHLLHEDFILMTEEERDDLKELSHIRLADDPEAAAQLWNILDGKASKWEEIYHNQPSDYAELDEEKIDNELDEFFGKEKGKSKNINSFELKQMRQYVKNLIISLYDVEPEHKDVIGYNKKGEDIPSKEESKQYKKENTNDTETETDESQEPSGD